MKAKGPLTLSSHCQMCGDHDKGARHRAYLEPGFDPSGRPKALCRECRIGSSALLADKYQTQRKFVGLIARMKTEEEFGQDLPESEDWIMTINNLIASARKLLEIRK